MASLKRSLYLLAPLLIAACKHPLEIQGQGDIIELNQGVRGCSLDEFNAGFGRCTGNQVLTDETVIYRALPRAGWRFSHWDGVCVKESPGDDCQLNYTEAFAKLWDDSYPDTPVPPLKAVFVEDNNAPDGGSYIAPSLGIEGNNAYASLLDALVFEDGRWRFTTQQASTREYFDRDPYYFERQPDGLLGTGTSASDLVSGGAATESGDFITVVDTDNSDNDISATYLVPKQQNAGANLFEGTYYCAHISTRAPGLASFFRAVTDGKGGGTMTLIADRFGRSGSASVSLSVSSDGRTLLDYTGMRLAGSLSESGDLFVGTEINDAASGAGICLRASANKSLFTVQGDYYGAWVNFLPTTAVTDILVDASGQTAESVLRDSLGGRSYFLAEDFMLVNFDGRLKTSSKHGAVSPDGGTMFIVDTSPNKSPTLVVYIKKT